MAASCAASIASSPSTTAISCLSFALRRASSARWSASFAFASSRSAARIAVSASTVISFGCTSSMPPATKVNCSSPPPAGLMRTAPGLMASAEKIDSSALTTSTWIVLHGALAKCRNRCIVILLPNCETEGKSMKAARWALQAFWAAALFAAIPASAFAQAPEPSDPAPEAETPAVPGATPAAAPTPRPRIYKDVLKDARALPGFFTLHQKDEKVWLEIRPEQFDVPFFFAYNIPRSIGERGLYGSQMGRSRIAFFRRIGDRVQLIARNDEFFAAQGTPQARFVAESFSDSLIASAPLASLPNPATKAVVVEANALLFTDIPGYLTRLEIAFRLPFALDARNSAIAQVNNGERLTGLQVRAHFAVPKLPAPPLNPPPGAVVPPPAPPKTVPDPRSLFVSFYYSFAQLPAEPWPPRPADQRIGHFTTSRVDYSEDTAVKPRVHYVQRWRLEKADPSAVRSEPKQAIVYWLDRNIPEKYRKSVAAGVLEWNKAFERIGFKDALVVKQQTEQDDFDTMDARHASIRWFTGADVGFAIGPSQ